MYNEYTECFEDEYDSDDRDWEFVPTAGQNESAESTEDDEEQTYAADYVPEKELSFDDF